MGSGWRRGGRRPRQFDRRVRTGMAVPDQAHREHPTDRDVLMALVSIARDTGDFETALRIARELVTLDSADRDYARWSMISKSASPASRHAICRPVDELNSEREVRNWHQA